MDNFYEQLETTYKTGKYKLVSSLVYIFGVLAFLGMVTGMFIPAILLIVLAALSYYFKKNLYIEYEYDFTNGEIDVDKIMEMQKRKRILTFSIKDVELLAPENSDQVKDFSNKPSSVLSCYPETTDKKVYVAMITGGTQRLQLRFTPDEELIAHCYKYNPRAVKKN